MIRFLDTETDARMVEKWNAYIGGHPYATIYHRLEWERVFRLNFGYKGIFLLNLDNDTPVGCVPLYLIRTPLGRRLVSVPFRDRGGILYSSASSFVELLDAITTVAEKEKARFVEIKSLNPYPYQEVEDAGWKECKYWVRSKVDLKGKDVGTYWKKIGYKVRNKVRQGEKAGLVFRDITNALGIKTWHRLYLKTQKRLGIPPFPAAFFRSMVDVFGPHNQIKIFGVMKDAEFIAATVVLLERPCAIYAYSASDTVGRKVRANDYMVFQTIKWLIEKKYTEFDMGSDSPRQKDLLEFKKKWTASQETIPFYGFGRINHATADSSTSTYELPRAFLRKLPDFMLKIIGKNFLKYFG